MATPSEKLAASLQALQNLQNRGVYAIQSSSLSRTHRERLLATGYIEEVVKGWYIATRPDEKRHSSTAWYANMREFVAGYCNARFSANWHLSPEQSLLLLSGDRTLPKQLQVWAPEGNNQSLQLLHGTSIWLYRAPKLLPALADKDVGGLRLVELASALAAVSASFFVQRPLAAQIALQTLTDTSDLAHELLEGEHSVVAGRLAGALRAVDRHRFADDIVSVMRSAHYTVQESNPFERELSVLPAGRPESPYVQRLRIMWAQMRPAVVAAFTGPGPVANDVDALLADIESRYVADAYHSLSIEGYRVTPELIERVRNGAWDPDGRDDKERDAMAAKGYFDTHLLVKRDIAAVISGQNPGRLFGERLAEWYRALFGPSVGAGILRAADLAGYRNGPVFIKRALHVPVSKETVRECMPVLFELLAREDHPAVRAVLGHFHFVYIHPYMDGNGRLARFLMNLMLTSGGYSWTIIPKDERDRYMKALEQASSFANIEPFAKFISSLLVQQAKEPLKRPGT